MALSNHKIRLANWNTHGVLNEKADIKKAILTCFEIDIFCITETCLFHRRNLLLPCLPLRLIDGLDSTTLLIPSSETCLNLPSLTCYAYLIVSFSPPRFLSHKKILQLRVWQREAERCHAVQSLFVPLLVLWPFFAQCLTQTHHLRSIPFPSDGFIRFQ